MDPDGLEEDPPWWRNDWTDYVNPSAYGAAIGSDIGWLLSGQWKRSAELDLRRQDVLQKLFILEQERHTRAGNSIAGAICGEDAGQYYSVLIHTNGSAYSTIASSAMPATPFHLPTSGASQVTKGVYGLNKAATASRRATSVKWGARIRYNSGVRTAIEHIKEGHFYNSRLGLKSSRFLERNSSVSRVKELVEEAFAKGTHTTSCRGDYSIVYTFDAVIGTDVRGSKTKTLQVFLDSLGNVLNAYPIGKP